MDPIRILSLDGGGSFAGVLAITLGKLYGEDRPGRDIIRQFDFIAANSGGSIVLAALCCNYTPGDIAGFYANADTVRRMYSPRWTEVFKKTWLRALFPPYSVDGKCKAIAELLDRKRQPGEDRPSTIALERWPQLIGCQTQFLVTAYDYDCERAAFFRSNMQSRAASSAPQLRATLIDAVNASTNGPIVFYGKPAVAQGRRFWDGGIAGYNNPVLAGLIEAMANMPGRMADFRVLSLGTSTRTRASASQGAVPPLGAPVASTGLAAAILKAATAVVADPPEAATFHAYVAMGHALPVAAEADQRLVRMSPFLHPMWNEVSGRWQLPRGLSMEEFVRLVDMKEDTMDASDLALIGKMCDLWMKDCVANQPVRIGEHMHCDIGDPTFGAAAAAWQTVQRPGDTFMPGETDGSPDSAA